MNWSFSFKIVHDGAKSLIGKNYKSAHSNINFFKLFTSTDERDKIARVAPKGTSHFFNFYEWQKSLKVRFLISVAIMIAVAITYQYFSIQNDRFASSNQPVFSERAELRA